MGNSLAVGLLLGLLGSGPLAAQEEPSRVELYGGYYYGRFNINANVSGIAPSETFNGNGGGGQLEYKANKWLGFVNFGSHRRRVSTHFSGHSSAAYNSRKPATSPQLSLSIFAIPSVSSNPFPTHYPRQSRIPHRIPIAHRVRRKQQSLSQVPPRTFTCAEPTSCPAGPAIKY
jgi:hypothetical protein